MHTYSEMVVKLQACLQQAPTPWEDFFNNFALYGQNIEIDLHPHVLHIAKFNTSKTLHMFVVFYSIKPCNTVPVCRGSILCM